MRQDGPVLISYLDESYTKDFYFIAAVIVDEVDAPALDEAIRRAGDYAAGFGVPAGTEMHAHKIMSGTNGFEAVRGKHRAAESIYAHALREIATVPITIYIRGVDVNRLNARYSYPRPPHQVALQYVLEDVSDFGKSRDSMVRVIADEVEDQEGHMARVAAFQITGTPGHRPNQLQNLQMPITFESSEKTPGLQAVDLVAYLHRRRQAHSSPDPRAAKTADKLWSEISEKVALQRTWFP